MRFSFSVRLILLLTILTAIPTAASASATISIGDFKNKSGETVFDFKGYLSKALSEAGFTCSNSTSPLPFSRYSLSGIVKKVKKGTSFSAMLTDNFHLEPEVFINGKQIGGKTSQPAAGQLAKSVTKLLSNQAITSIEVNGDSRLTPNAIMALAQIRPGEIATPEKVIAARIILENCGLFEQVQLYLTPGSAGRKLKISVKEKEMVIAGSMPGPGKETLDNILGPAEHDLAKFPVSETTEIAIESNSTGYLAYRADDILGKISHSNENYLPEEIEELVIISAAIRDQIYSYDKSCQNMGIVLMKLCSVLDSRIVKIITEDLQKDMTMDSNETGRFEKTLARIEFIAQAYSAAQEVQLTLASRLYKEKAHSPVTPWILYSLGEQALKAENITKAAPLLAGAISISSLPVAPEMLVTTAKAQYSNLDHASGDAASELLRPLLAQPNLTPELRKQIHELLNWTTLCETATSITPQDSFELQLKKGNALILLDRPDLAEPLFHELHSIQPNDARPFTGFARLAFQRTGNLLSARPYIERAAHLSHKDRFFYELALAFKLERIIGEALPTIQLDGRSSEEASATRFLLAKAMQYANGYEKLNKPQASLILKGISVLDEWLAYPSMHDNDALSNMFRQTMGLRKEMPTEPEIISANYYFSIFSPDRADVQEMLGKPLAGPVGLTTRFLQLNLLMREMALAPSPEIATALEQAEQATFSDARSRGEAVALQADAHAILGFYRNSADELERADSLYELAVGIGNSEEKARLLSNQACVNLALGHKNEADDLFDEALDCNPEFLEAVNIGKTASSLSGKEQKQALLNLAHFSETEEIKIAAIIMSGTAKDKDATAAERMRVNRIIAEQENQTRMTEIALQEESRIKAEYDNYKGLQLNFKYESNLWLLPCPVNLKTKN